MNKLASRLAVAALLAGLVLAPLSAAPKEKNLPQKAPPRGSIRPRGNPNALERAALAKIDFQEAMQAAIKAVPGKVISGELDIDEGNLEYDFEIISAANKVMDVSIDAGNGKVLDVDEGDL